MECARPIKHLRNPTLAEDLVQESYFRFLRATLKSDDPAYQKAYLFRIATNLARDHWRRQPYVEQGEAADLEQAPADDRTAEQVQQRSDLGRVLGRMKPRERELLWLAYVEGASHKEIAEVLRLRAPSVRLLLFRARQKMRQLLHRSRLAMKDPADASDGSGS